MAQAKEERASDAWREALATRRSAPAEIPVPAAAAARPVRGLPRRRFIAGSFWAGIAASATAGAGAFLDFFYPRNTEVFGGPVPAGHIDDYRAGGPPVRVHAAHCYVVNLDPQDETRNGGGRGDGLLALWWKCPHLGCTVPWLQGFPFEGDRGWFRCPCHQSTYTKAGVRVFGPAPRSMDTMALSVDAEGRVTIQTGLVTPGGEDNPTRALRFARMG